MTEPKLCVTVTGPSMDDLRRGRDAASRRRPRRAASRPRRPAGRRGRARGAADSGHRHLPREVGGRTDSRAARKSGAASSIGRGAWRRVRRRRGGGRLCVRLHRLAPRAGHRAVVARLRRSAGGPCASATRPCARPAPRSTKLAIQVTTLAETLPLFDLGATAADDAGRRAMSSSRWATRACRRASCRRGCATGGRMRATASRPVRFRRLVSCAISGSGESPPTPRSTPSSATRSSTRGRRSCTTRASRRSGLNAVYVPLEARDADDFARLCDAHGRAGREHHGSRSRSA